MRVRHPYALDEDAPDPDDTVHWGGRREWSDVDDDDTFYVPDDRARAFVEGWPTAEGHRVDALLVTEAESGASDDAADDEAQPPEHGGDGDTCAARTGSGDPCGNPAGADGYCHLAGHGPEDG